MTPHYTPVAKTLHWLMAVLLFGLLALGFTMTDLPLSPRKLQLYSWHKWAAFDVVANEVQIQFRITAHPGE
jgi:cytochrome b561